MKIGLTDVIGLAGVVMMLGAYILLQRQKMKFDDYPFLSLNAAGSFFVVISLLREFNIAAFFVETAWVAVSLFGIYQRWTRNES